MVRRKYFETSQTRRATRVETPRTDAPKPIVQNGNRQGITAFPDGRIIWHDSRERKNAVGVDKLSALGGAM
jgi:hypothetical protein